MANKTTVTGQEANMLLYALDYFYGTDENGKVCEVICYEMPPLSANHPVRHFKTSELQTLRDKLFAVHKH